MRALTAVATAAAVGATAGACGTRYVDLLLPADAGATPALDAGAAEAAPAKCEIVMRADGTPCQICYDPNGMLSSNCVPAPGSADGGTGGSGGTPVDACKVMAVMDTRCLMCPPMSGAAMPATICLACQAPVKTSAAGDYCRTCAWQDQMKQCLECFTADGTATFDDCDALRI